MVVAQGGFEFKKEACAITDRRQLICSSDGRLRAVSEKASPRLASQFGLKTANLLKCHALES
jgi:hypothetical protein